MNSRRVLFSLFLLGAVVHLPTNTAVAQVPGPSGAEAAKAQSPSADQLAQLAVLEKSAAEHEKAARNTQAITVREEILARQRNLYGKDSTQVLATLRTLAALYERLEAFAAALEQRQEALNLVTGRVGEKHWRTVNARLELEFTETLSKLSRTQRRRLKDADEVQAKANAFSQRGKYLEAVEALAQRLQIDREVLGGNHWRVGDDQFELAMSHRLLDELGPADTYIRQAYELRKAAYGEQHPVFASTLNQWGLISWARKDTQNALAQLTSAGEIWKATQGENSSDYCAVLNNLGLVHQQTGDRKSAEERIRQALVIGEKLPGEALSNAIRSQNLSDLLKQDKRFDEARALLLNALAIREKLLAPDHPNLLSTVQALVNLASAQRLDALAREDFAAARQFGEEELKWIIRRYGEAHYLVKRGRAELDDSDRLAAISPDDREKLKAADTTYAELVELNKRGKLVDAVQKARDAAVARQLYLGKLNLGTILATEWLGNELVAQKDFDEAETYLRAVLAARKEIQAVDDPMIASTRGSLIGLVQKRAAKSLAEGRFESAIEDYEQEIELTTSSYGEKHWKTTDARLHKIGVEQFRALAPEQRKRLEDGRAAFSEGQRLHVMGRFPEARARLQASVSLISDALGSDTFESVRPLEMLGRCARDLADYSGAEQILRQAVAVSKQHVGTEHPQYAYSLRWLGSVLLDKGEIAAAEPLILEAAQTTKRLEGAASANYGAILSTAGILYERKGDVTRREVVNREVLEIARQTYGESHSNFATALINVAQVLFNRSELARAEAMYREALGIRKKALGESHPDVASALNFLSTAVQRQNRLPEAIDLRMSALSIQRQLLGEKAVATVGTATVLAEWHSQHAYQLLAAENFPAAQQAAQRGIDLFAQTFGEKDWRVRECGVTLYRIQTRERLSPEQRKAVVEADRKIQESDRLLRERKYAEATAILEKVREEVRGIVGEDDPLWGTLGNRLGNRYFADKEYDKADSMYRLDLAIREKHYGKDHPQYALCLAVLGGVAEGKSDFAAAEELHKEALELRRKARGLRHADTLDSLTRLAALYEKWAAGLRISGDFGGATAKLRKALECKQERYGDKDWHTIDARLALESAEKSLQLDDAQRQQLAEAEKHYLHGQSLFTEGKYGVAGEECRKALDLRASVLGQDDRLTRDAQFAYAMALHFSRTRNDADRQYEEVLEWRQKSLGELHPGTAMARYRLAQVHMQKGKYGDAEQELTQCLEVNRQTLGPEHPECGIILHNLAIVALRTAQVARAEHLARQAYNIALRAYGENSKSAGEAAAGLGEIYCVLGDYARAEPLLRKAVANGRQSVGPRHPHVADSLLRLSRFYTEVGDVARAEATARETLSIYEETRGPDHYNVADACLRLGRVMREKGDLDKAESYYRRALDIRAKLYGTKSGGYAECLSLLGILSQQRKDYDQADLLLSQAMEIRESVYGTDDITYSLSAFESATASELRGDYAKAAMLLREAARIRGRKLGHKHPLYAESMRALGRVEWKLGETTNAQDHLNESLALARATLAHAASAQSERQQLLMCAALRGYLDDYLSLALDSSLPGDAVYEHVLAWKGTVFARQLHAREMRAAREGADPALLKLYTRLEEVSSRLALLALSPQPASGDAGAKGVKDLTEELEDLESELAEKSADFRTRKAREALTPAELQAVLPEDAVLIDFLEFEHTGRDPNDHEKWTSGRRLAAFILRRGQPIRLLDLGDSKPVTLAIDDWRGRLKVTATPAVGESPAATLSRLIWQPLREHIGGAQTILLSPDGPLSQLSFAALPGEKPDSYLIEDRALAVIPVPQLLPELLATETPTAPNATPALLVLGNVSYGASPGTASDTTSSRAAAEGPNNRLQFGPLEATAGEILMVRKYFQKRFREGHAELLEEEEATEQHFRVFAPKHEWLHLATHGFFAIRKPASAASSAVRGSSEEESAGVHPGLLSGLAMSGANAPADPAHDDGILTALEVAQLDLRRVQLAVLSACETGLGRTVGGEGVLGLQRSFQVAGARGVVASLWSVDDTQTRALMERFYRNLWEKKMSKLESLREAQIWMLREAQRGVVRDKPESADSHRLSPFYWAAFVLSGDWR